MNKRLTRKINDRYFCAKQADEFDGSEFIEANQKLGQLEDIEDELGIDLVTLFKILRTGGYIYVKNCKGINYWHVESLKQRGLNKQWYITYSNNVRVKLKDYGETWALTKEELLND